MSKNEGTSNFAELMKAIDAVGDDTDALLKSDVLDKDGPGAATKDDKTIAAAGAASNEEGENDDDADGGGPDMTKAMTVIGADGKPIEAIDATDLIKSLQDKVGEHDTLLAKALGSIGAALQKQGALIKSLQDTVVKLSGQGAGRKAYVLGMEKPGVGATDTLAKAGSSAEAALSPEDFFMKAETAFANKKLSGQELNTISVCMRMNAPLDPALIRKVALAS